LKKKDWLYVAASKREIFFFVLEQAVACFH
jgi:hypothetical protein